MKLNRDAMSRLVKALIFTALCTFVVPTSSAQILDEEIGNNAVALARKIESNQLILADVDLKTNLDSPDLSQDEQLGLLRDEFIRVAWIVNKDIIGQISKDYKALAQTAGTKADIEIGQLFETFVNQYEIDYANDSATKVRVSLEPFLESSDWFVQHHAYTLDSLSYPPGSNLSLALESAQSGLKLIPEESNHYVVEARILSLSGLAYLNSMLLNVEQSLENYSELIDLQLANNKSVDGLSVINNLIYTFGAWREQNTTKELLDILLSLEKTYPSSVPGLTEGRASLIYAELGEYETSLKYARQALALTQIKAVRRSAQLIEIISLAGLGQLADAEQALTLMQESYSEEEWQAIASSGRMFEAKAHISLANGEYLQALRYMNQKLDASVQKILNKNNSQTSSLLASLQNSKGRQDERALAFKREAKLQKIALDRQHRITQLLIILSIVLLVIVIAATLFARYRSKIATRMEIAAKKAMAGEKSKAEFLAVMSHELRTPLNGILGMADILSREASSPAMKQKTDIIVDSGQDLLDLVENIFDMTLIESQDIHLYPERVNIHDALTKSINKWRPQIEKKDTIFTAHIGPNVPQYMDVDKTRFIKPVEELLSNACKFTQNGRVHIHVTAAATAQPSTELTELKIIVADTGVGIGEDAQTRLFKPFVQADSSMTRHFGGAGLGLAIGRGLARLMDGDIAVNSRMERGSEFTFTLNAPALSAPEKAQEKASDNSRSGRRAPAVRSSENARPQTPAQTISLPTARILIAEDDLGSQDVLRSLLEPTGARLIYTINGQEALEALSLNHFDLVITDIRMPGMDGVTAIRRIRQSRQDHSNIPIIALTADVAAETNSRCVAAGVDLFLTKPIKSSELYAAIAHVMTRLNPAERQKKVS